MRAPVLVLLLLLSGCSIVQEATEVSRSAIEGELSIQVPGGGEEPVVWRPNVCMAGENEQFFGFILGVEGSGIVVRAVVDPLDGAGLRLVWPNGTMVFREHACERLALEVAPTGWRVNDIQDVSGRLEVRCSGPDGASVEGSLEVRHCH